jgi:hypothetical protein
MNECFLSLQDARVTTRNGIEVSQIDTEGPTSRAASYHCLRTHSGQLALQISASKEWYRFCFSAF